MAAIDLMTRLHVGVPANMQTNSLIRMKHSNYLFSISSKLVVGWDVNNCADFCLRVTNNYQDKTLPSSA
jgi:hypothetical protein